MAMKIHVAIFCVVISCRDVVGYPEDGGNIVLRNIGILPYHYTALQSRRLRLDYLNEVRIFRN
jgi:hypothetical protein